MEQTTKYFILKDSGLHYIPDMPEKPIGVFRTEEIPVVNQEEVIARLILNNKSLLEPGEIYPLECDVEIRSECCTNGNPIYFCQECTTGGIEVAFVKLKEETKEELKSEEIPRCPTCGVECEIGGDGETHFYIPKPKEVAGTKEEDNLDKADKIYNLEHDLLNHKELIDEKDQQIQSLQEEQTATKKLLVESVANNFYKEKEINQLREEMKKKEEQIKVLFGKCVEGNCENPAVIDYNGHKHYVCQPHYESLTRYFEEEYK